MATRSCSSRCMAEATIPMPPVPRIRSISYFPPTICPGKRGGRAPVGVTYSPGNDGTHRTVTAHLHNEFEETFPDARAVFVLPVGKYRAQGGRIESSVASDDGKYVVVAVRFDLAAKSKGAVVVGP